MSGPYLELLDAAILHLESLKQNGRRYIEVSPEALDQLSGKAVGGKPEGLARSRAPLPSSPPLVASVPELRLPAPIEIVRAAPPIAADAGSKAAGMAELSERAKLCVKCPNLASSRRNVVFGVGDI